MSCESDAELTAKMDSMLASGVGSVEGLNNRYGCKLCPNTWSRANQWAQSESLAITCSRGNMVVMGLLAL